jgi:hypothetical protein
MAKGKKNRGRKKVEEKKVEVVEENLRIQDKIFVVFCIVMFFVAFYLLTLYITHKNTEKNDTEEAPVEATISYDEIVIGRSLSMSDKDYLVIYYDNTNADISTACGDAVNNYRSNNTKKIYYVDMSSMFNSSHVTEGESNKNPETAKDLLINGPTVIHVLDGKVVDYVEGLDSVVSYLN